MANRLEIPDWFGSRLTVAANCEAIFAVLEMPLQTARRLPLWWKTPISAI